MKDPSPFPKKRTAFIILSVLCLFSFYLLFRCLFCFYPREFTALIFHSITALRDVHLSHIYMPPHRIETNFKASLSITSI